MPYELSFIARVPTLPREQYINDCCVGGDAIVGLLLPSVQARYANIDSGEEDWGWYIWFETGELKLAVDVFTDDPDAGEFRIHLTSRRKRRFFRDTIVDTPQLEELCTLVVAELQRALGTTIHVRPVDENYG